MREITPEKSLQQLLEKTISTRQCEDCFGGAFTDCEECLKREHRANRKDRFRELMSNVFDTDEVNHMEHDLDELGFFDAPASIKYHGCETGGLFEHSYCVTNTLLKLTEDLGLKWKMERSPYLIGMFHDLCKCESYTWDNAEAEWKYNKEMTLPGHGEKSAMMAMRLTYLSEEEMMCIRWHMGAFDDNKNWEYFTRAVHENPNVLYVHMADMIASQVHGV